MSEEIPKQRQQLRAASIVLPRKPKKPSKPADKSHNYDEKMKLYNTRIEQFPGKLKDHEAWVSSHREDIEQHRLYQQLLFGRRQQRHRCRKVRNPVYIAGLE